MKYIIALLALGIGIWGLVTWEIFTKHPNWFYGGLVVLGLLVLGIAVWVAKKLAKFIGWSFTSSVYLVVVMIILGLLAHYDKIPSMASLIGGVILGGLLAVMIIRRIAFKADKSLYWGEIFAWVTGYKLHYVMQDEKIMEVEIATKDKIAMENIIGALTTLQYSKKESKEAANYALEEIPNGKLAEQVKCALNFLHSEEVLDDVEE
jgi:hypothetical protein